MIPTQITFHGASVEVSSVNPANDKWLLLQVAEGRMGIFTKDGVEAGLLNYRTNQSSTPRWSRTEANILYFLEGASVMRYNVITDTISLEKAFQEYDSITTFGEGDLSEDGDHLFLAGKKYNTIDTFVYEFTTKKRLNWRRESKPIDGLKLAGNVPILSRGGHGLGEGIFVLEGLSERLLADANGHAATYKNYLLWCSSDSPTLNGNHLARTDVNTGATNILATYNWAKYALHIATCEQAFCVPSLDCPDNSLPAQIWQVFYDGRPKRLLYEWQNVYHKDFQVRAALSRDGTRLYFNKYDGKMCNVWMLKLDGPSSPIIQGPTTTRIDYSQFLGKAFPVRVRGDLLLTPRPDGGCDLSGVVDIYDPH